MARRNVTPGGWAVRCGAAAAVLAVATGCGSAPAADGVVTVEQLREPQPFYEGPYLGSRVVVTGRVAERPAPDQLALSGMGGTLTVLATGPVTVQPGQVVRVTGTVGQLHTLVPAEQAPYIQSSLYDEASTDPYLFDATVESATG